VSGGKRGPERFKNVIQMKGKKGCFLVTKERNEIAVQGKTKQILVRSKGTNFWQTWKEVGVMARNLLANNRNGFTFAIIDFLLGP
jgi:hypothetical protein